MSCEARLFLGLVWYSWAESGSGNKGVKAEVRSWLKALLGSRARFGVQSHSGSRLKPVLIPAALGCPLHAFPQVNLHGF